MHGFQYYFSILAKFHLIFIHYVFIEHDIIIVWTIKIFLSYLNDVKIKRFIELFIPYTARKLNDEISSDISSPSNLLHFKLERLLLNLPYVDVLNSFHFLFKHLTLNEDILALHKRNYKCHANSTSNLEKSYVCISLYYVTRV